MVFSSQNKNLKNAGAPLSLPRINIKKYIPRTVTVKHFPIVNNFWYLQTQTQKKVKKRNRKKKKEKRKKNQNEKKRKIF